MVSHAINSTTSPTITTTTSTTAATTTNNANDTDDYDDESSRAARAVFLALILAVACVSSVLLLHAALRYRRSRHGAHSVLILNLLLLSLGDALLDMPVVMGSLLASTSWVFPDALCKTHAFLMSLVLMETGLGLAALALDSYLAVKYLERHDALLSPVRVGLVVGVTWLLSVSFSAPFLTEAVRLAFRPQLHTCSVADETPLVFVCLASAVCFLAPALLMVVAFCLLRREGARQQQVVKVVVTQSQYTDELMEEPRLWREMARAKYVGILCLMWFVLEVPYMVTIFIQQYRLSKELHFSVDYPWAVDVAFLWVRFSFSAVLPCVTLACKKELWQSCKKCFVCRRSNSVLDVKATADPSRVNTVRKVPPSPKPPPRRDQAKANAPNSLLSFNVPVLFATSDGIHIETPHTDSTGQGEAREAGDRQRVLQGRQLDVADPCAEDGGLPADASEYDSSSGTECSSPQILSARHIRGALADTPPSALSPLETYHESGAPDDNEDGDDNDDDRVANEARDWDREPHRTVVPVSGQSGYHEDHHPIPSDLADPTDVKNGGHTSLAPNSLPSPTEEGQRTSVSDSHSYCHNNPDNSSSSSALSQDRPQPSAPRVQGRLKPLPANKKKAEWPERKLFSGKDPAASTGADHTKEKIREKQTAVKGSMGKGQGTADTDLSRPVREGRKKGQGTADTDLSRPVREGRKKGHKRTQTSDSAKALLGSNSSVEIANNARARGSDSDSAHRQESF